MPRKCSVFLRFPSVSVGFRRFPSVSLFGKNTCFLPSISGVVEGNEREVMSASVFQLCCFAVRVRPNVLSVVGMPVRHIGQAVERNSSGCVQTATARNQPHRCWCWCRCVCAARAVTQPQTRGVAACAAAVAAFVTANAMRLCARVCCRRRNDSANK